MFKEKVYGRTDERPTKTDHNTWVPRFTVKTQITGKTTEIPERPKNNRELKYAVHLFMY